MHCSIRTASLLVLLLATATSSRDGTDRV